MRTFAILSVTAAACAAQGAEPFRLHPENPHYFEFRGKPTVLITSAEHYGAVLNAGFDYRLYLEALAKHGLNNTRLFTGTYREVPGNFAITRNTLAPEPARFLAPWARSSVAGALEGGNKFDLEKWDPRYFTRLRDFIAEAGRRGVVVEVNLFCPLYEDSMWSVSPMNAANNAQGIGDVPRSEVLTMKHPALVRAQEAVTRRIVEELKDFDNVYYEIANEPYFGGVTLEWQAHIASVIRQRERELGARHLISQNIGNGSQRIDQPLPEVDFFNFHYSKPPDSVALNYDLGRPIGNNETGFDGSADAVYRTQGWQFLLAGGALYNNLDYSFVVGHERGDFAYPATTPGGGGEELRMQLGGLLRFMQALPFVKMRPDRSWLRGGGLPEGARLHGLAQPGVVYAAYVHHRKTVQKDMKPGYQIDDGPQRISLSLSLPAGSWRVAWTEPRTGKTLQVAAVTSGAGVPVTLNSPEYREDIALRLDRPRP